MLTDKTVDELDEMSDRRMPPFVEDVARFLDPLVQRNFNRCYFAGNRKLVRSFATTTCPLKPLSCAALR